MDCFTFGEEARGLKQKRRNKLYYIKTIKSLPQNFLAGANVSRAAAAFGTLTALAILATHTQLALLAWSVMLAISPTEMNKILALN